MALPPLYRYSPQGIVSLPLVTPSYVRWSSNALAEGIAASRLAFAPPIVDESDGPPRKHILYLVPLSSSVVMRELAAPGKIESDNGGPRVDAAASSNLGNSDLDQQYF